MEELLPVLFSDHVVEMDVHDLALILMTLSAGAAGDLSLPAYNKEAEVYYELSMMAMSMRSLLESEGASLSTVQTFMLGGVHHLVSGRMNSLEPIWKIQSFACVLAFSVSAAGTTLCDPCANNDALDWATSVFYPHLSCICSSLTLRTDRDPASWKLDEKLIQRRRQVFWELFVVDKWKVSSSFVPPTKILANRLEEPRLWQATGF